MTTFYRIKSNLFDEFFIKKLLFARGKIWSWGDNSYGQLGDNTATKKSSPVQVITGDINWMCISANQNQTAAIKTNGRLWAWGDNSYGQLGDNTQVNRSSPVQTAALGINWKIVSVGRNHMSAIKTDGTLWSWGDNSYGQLGTNNTTSRSSPVQIAGAGTAWKLIAAGSYHSLAIKTDGTLWAWGGNGLGELGDDSGSARSSPIQTTAGGTDWKRVAAGSYHSMGIKTDGTLWVWGYNLFGALGDGTTDSKYSPVQTAASGTNWQSVDGGGLHTVAIKTNSSIWSWGYNSSGQLGDQTRTSRSSPVLISSTNWKLLAAGDQSTFAIKDDYYS